MKGVGADEYCSILEAFLIPEGKTLFKKNRQGMVFQQDNAPGHTSKKSKMLLSKKDFEVLDWPANSPDLSPIENAWAHLKYKIK